MELGDYPELQLYVLLLQVQNEESVHPHLLELVPVLLQSYDPQPPSNILRVPSLRELGQLREEFIEELLIDLTVHYININY